LWSPGVKLGVQPGSFFQLTECFGPVLGVMRAADLDDALALQNAPEFGLTAGLHSLDPDEIEFWLERIQAGNVYVNRHTTGAIIRRQPFGGWKHSSVGPGAKAGGPNDILRFVRCEAAAPFTVDDARRSFAQWWESTFAREIDDSGLRSEANLLRYRPIDTVVVAGGPATTAEELDVLRAAARTTGVAIAISPAGDSDGARIRSVTGRGVTRLRALAPVTDAVARASHRANVAIDDAPVTAHGRIELPRWLREQAISRTLHRHGRVPGWN
jgi:RHH-type proline utilization regulon transcriptional repressor/proline dehydrogenase/delta 1-pyrroline-5-carboxylate dehydrogenase